MKKKCSKCNVEKELKEFNKCKKYKDGVLKYCKVCKNEVRRKNTALNKDIRNAWKRNYLKNNVEQRKKHLERLKKYNEKTKDKNIIYRRLYEKKRVETDKLFLLRRRIKNSISGAFKRTKNRKNNKTEKILGCSFAEFKKYIELIWEPWMNWNNYGKYNGTLNYGWDLDHIIPVSSSKTEEDIIKLNYYTNFQPLCTYINRVIKKDKNK